MTTLVALATSGDFAVLAANDGQVTGTVTNRTTGEPAAGATVVLSRFEDQGWVEDITTTTDDKGAYAFAGLDTSDGIVFVTSVNHDTVLYGSGMIRVSDAPHQTADLTIYETTTDQSAVRVASRGIIVTAVDADSGEVSCLDVFAFEFDSDRTLIQGNDGRTVRFPVPPTALEVSPGTGFNFGAPSIDGATVYSTGPLYPGESTATLTWNVPYDGESVSISVDNAYPTGSLRILVPFDAASIADSLSVAGDSFVDQGIVTVGDTDYHVWSTGSIAESQTIQFELAGLPYVERGSNRLRTAEPLLLVVGCVAAGAAIVAWIVHTRNLARPRPVTVAPAAAAPLTARRDELLGQLRQIEADRAAAAVDDLTYATERRSILLELRSISRQMRGAGDDE